MIAGDIHGQYYDMINVIGKKHPKKYSYLFLGDYVDRGIYSIECVLLLFAIKINFPSTFFMLRGNHESRMCAEHFSFRTEMLEKYDEETYDLCMNTFDCLPLVGVIGGEYLCMHGGISPELTDLDAVNAVNRFIEVPQSGLFTDLLWSDPVDNEIACSKNFTRNKERQCSVKFGNAPLQAVLQKTKMSMLLRGH